MGDRLDEAIDRGKAVINDLLGDESTEREGELEAERARLEPEVGGSLDRGKGELDRGTGEADEVWGEAIDDPGLDTGGTVPRIEDDVRRAG